MIPIARPMQLPIAMEGKKMPAGTLIPKVTAVMIVFAKAVTLAGIHQQKSVLSGVARLQE